ncbi:MAG: electron transfer flavoprotein subunit beta/FixA family protein [Candidatus Methylomirabilia bacterium]
MTALVLLRQVLDATLPFEIVPGQGVRLKGPEAIRILNPADRVALEWACRLCGDDVTALTVAPPEASEVLRLAQARGARRAVRLWAEGAECVDGVALARLLALAVARLRPDLILTGDQSLEGGTGSVPGLLAARLGWPCLDGAVHVARDRRRVVIRRPLERGWQEEVEADAPVAITVEAGSIEPSYVSVRTRREARARPVEVWGLGDLGVSLEEVRGWVRSEVISVDWPRPRAKKVHLPDAGVPARERMRQLLAGVTAPKKAAEAKLIEGDAGEIAERFVEFLAERGFVHARVVRGPA